MSFSGIEKAWRVGWMRAIGAMSAGESVATPPAWSDREWSLLFMRTQGIGDMILATGILRAIARAQPTIALDVLTSPRAAPVLEGNPYVRRVLTMPRDARGIARMARTIRRSKYDVLVDGRISRGASFVRSPALAAFSRAPYRVGVDGGNHRFVYNLCVERFDRASTHMIDGSVALAMPFAPHADAADMRPEIFLTEGETNSACREWLAAARGGASNECRWLINISAGAPIRRWPHDRWIALIKHLLARRPSATIAVIGDVREWASVQEVAQASGAAAVNTGTLRSALAMVATSARVITADTSITHAASAFCIPTVVLLQRGLTQWLPWQTPHSVAYWSGSTIESLSVGVASDALDELLYASV
jgi:heptosyltransferase-2